MSFLWDLPIGVFIIILIYALIEKIVDKIEKTAAARKHKKKFEVFPLYHQLKELDPSERQKFLDGLPPRERKRYEYALSVWDHD